MEKEPGKKLLMIFYRNPEIGKVKTRLAATMGDGAALAIYLKLVSHTRTITEDLTVDKTVYYSSYVDTEDNWPNHAYKKFLQRGNDLGEKMEGAFAKGFDLGYSSICIVGTDCYELTGSIIEQAFESLRTHDAVIGPANDGGYYLLGMNKLLPELFHDKKWSTETVFTDTIADLKNLGLTYYLLHRLNDVDTEADLPPEFRAY